MSRQRKIEMPGRKRLRERERERKEKKRGKEEEVCTSLSLSLSLFRRAPNRSAMCSRVRHRDGRSKNVNEGDDDGNDENDEY